MVLFATIKQKLMFFLLGKADLGSHWRWRRHGTFMFWPFKYRVYGGKNLAWQELSPGSDSSPGRTVSKLVGTKVSFFVHCTKQKLMFFLLGKADLGSHWRWRRHGTFMFWPFKYRVYGGKNLAWQELSPGSDSSPGRTLLKLIGTSNWKFAQNLISQDFENLMIIREFEKVWKLDICRN